MPILYTYPQSYPQIVHIGKRYLRAYGKLLFLLYLRAYCLLTCILCAYLRAYY